MARVDLTETDCWCGLPFAIPTRLFNQCKNNGTTFHCPLGHAIVFSETEADKLRRERDRLKQREAQKNDQINDLHERIDTEERRTAAYKGQVTKMKKRAKAGVCSCCNRHFVNLERHMASKHPNMDPEEELKVIEGGKK